jgi:hypothetical protein
LFITIPSLIVKTLSVPKLINVITPRDNITFDNEALKVRGQKIVKYKDYTPNTNFWIYRLSGHLHCIIFYGSQVLMFRFVSGSGYLKERDRKTIQGRALPVYISVKYSWKRMLCWQKNI